MIQGGENKIPGLRTSLLWAVLAISACGSVSVVRQHNEKGFIREVQVREKGLPRLTILFDYDGADRVTSVSKMLPARKTPAAVRSLIYDAQGRLKIHAHRETLRQGNRDVEDIWVESFFYGYSGELIRSETSFKSAFSIARSKTPLLVTRYFYDEGLLRRCTMQGGVFRSEALLDYKKSDVYRIEYKKSSYRRQEKRFEPELHLEFRMEDGVPVRAKNLMTGTALSSRKEAVNIFRVELIEESLRRLAYSSDIKLLLSDLERSWTR